MATDFEENKKVETTKLVITKFVVAVGRRKAHKNEDLAEILKIHISNNSKDRIKFLGFLSFWKT